MSVGDWTAIVEAAALIYLAWQQNRIFERQNKIFAAPAGQSAMPNKVALRSFWVRLIQYWPTLVMLALMALTGYDIYDRHHPGFSPIWAVLFFGLTVALVAVGVRHGPIREVRQIPTPNKLVIRRAVYAAGLPTEEVVTDQLNNAARDALVIIVDNGLGGLLPRDPASGARKRLDVEYSYGSDTRFNVSRMESPSGSGEVMRLVLPEDTEVQRLTKQIEATAVSVEQRKRIKLAGVLESKAGQAEVLALDLEKVWALYGKDQGIFRPLGNNTLPDVIQSDRDKQLHSFRTKYYAHVDSVKYWAPGFSSAITDGQTTRPRNIEYIDLREKLKEHANMLRKLAKDTEQS